MSIINLIDMFSLLKRKQQFFHNFSSGLLVDNFDDTKQNFASMTKRHRREKVVDYIMPSLSKPKQPAVVVLSCSNRRSPLSLLHPPLMRNVPSGVYPANLSFHRAFNSLSNECFFISNLKEEMEDHQSLSSNVVA